MKIYVKSKLVVLRASIVVTMDKDSGKIKEKLVLTLWNHYEEAPNLADDIIDEV